MVADDGWDAGVAGGGGDGEREWARVVGTDGGGVLCGVGLWEVREIS